MICDQMFNFSPGPNGDALSGTSDTVSSNVYDAGSAQKIFGGGGKSIKIPVWFNTIAGTTPTVRARFVAADNAALTTNPIILADTGVSRVIVAGDNGYFKDELVPLMQVDSKRYYGMIYTLGGTSPTANVVSQGVLDAQSAGAPGL